MNFSAFILNNLGQTVDKKHLRLIILIAETDNSRWMCRIQKLNFSAKVMGGKGTTDVGFGSGFKKGKNVGSSGCRVLEKMWEMKTCNRARTDDCQMRKTTCYTLLRATPNVRNWLLLLTCFNKTKWHYFHSGWPCDAIFRLRTLSATSRGSGR